MFALLYMRHYLLATTSTLGLVESAMAASNTNREDLLPEAHFLINGYTLAVYGLTALEAIFIIYYNWSVWTPSPENVYKLEIWKEQALIRNFQKGKLCVVLVTALLGIAMMFTINERGVNTGGLFSFIFAVALSCKVLAGIMSYDGLCDEHNESSFCRLLNSKDKYNIGWLDVPESVVNKIAEAGLEESHARNGGTSSSPSSQVAMSQV